MGAGQAKAASASVGYAIWYSADPGEQNNVTFTTWTVTSGVFFIEDTGATIRAGNGCERVTPMKVKCFADISHEFGYDTFFEVNLGDGDDRLTNETNVPTLVSAEEGNDVLSGGAGQDEFHGGDGTDVLRGGDGCDMLTGDADSDFLDGGSGPDRLGGAGGADTADYGNRSGSLNVSLDTPADYGAPRPCEQPGNDGVAGEGDVVFDDVENIWGGTGNDILTGDSDTNVIDAGPGNDRLDGGLGADNLIGGDGQDNAEYMTRTYPAFPTGVFVSLDGVANDGAPNEGDNIFADIENVWGTSMNDTLIGAQSVPNMLQGMGGNDTLSGGEPPCGQLCASGRPDRLDGGPGYDTIDYRGRGSVAASNDGLANDGAAGEMDNDVAFEYVIRDFIRIR